jgi:hypothetical protein
MTTWRMRISRWIPRTTDTLSEYAILIALPLQQWLHERASVLRNRLRTLPFLFLLHSVYEYIGCRTRPACYSMSIGTYFLSTKAARA